MQIRCYSCKMPISIGRALVNQALDIIHEDDLVYFDFRCPKCKKSNRVSKQQLQHASPTWEYKPKAKPQVKKAASTQATEAEGAGKETPAKKSSGTETSAEKSAPKKAPAAKKPAKTEPAKKAPAAKKPAKKEPAKKAPAAKKPAKKEPAKKTPAKKADSKK